MQNLTALYGPAATSGMGSAVFTVHGATADSLMTEAMSAYRHFVGENWDKRKNAWEAGFKELYLRAPGIPVASMPSCMHCMAPGCAGWYR